MPSAGAHEVHAADSEADRCMAVDGTDRVPRARRDGRDGSCANGRPRDVGCIDASGGERSSESGVQHLQPPCSRVRSVSASSSSSRTARCSCADPIAWAVTPVLLVSGVCHPRIETPAGPKKGQCLLRGRRGDPFSARATSYLLMPAKSELRCEDQKMGQSLLTRAAQGEQEAFRELTDPYRRELRSTAPDPRLDARR